MENCMESWKSMDNFKLVFYVHGHEKNNAKVYTVLSKMKMNTKK